MASVKTKGRSRLLAALLLCTCGILANFVFSRLVNILRLPLYLDNIGTMLTAALGGYIPGIVVGFLTNILNGLNDGTSYFYGSLNMLTAVTTAWMSKRGLLRKPKGIVTLILATAFIGGVGGSLLSWAIFGGDFGPIASSPLAVYLFEHGISSVFLSNFLADVLVDLLDKAITGCACIAILSLLPQAAYDATNFFSWRTIQEKHIKVRSMTVGAKIMSLITFAVFAITLSITLVTYNQFHEAAIDNQMTVGKSIAQIIASQIDGNMVDEYIANGEAAQGYKETEDRLYVIFHSYADIQYVYAYQIKEDGCHVVFDLDTADIDGGEPGEIIEFDESFAPYLSSLLKGEYIDPVISDDTFGWLMTMYYPVFDDNGICQCYAAVDLSMPRITASEHILLARTFSLFMCFFVFLLVSGVFLAQRTISFPINSISYAAQSFDYNSDQTRQESLERLEKLSIHTGDEIENLYDSFVKTTRQTVHYINETARKNEEIANLQNALIMILADVVESRDKCTGDHIRNTAAYTKIIMNQMRKEGLHKEELTDEFIIDVFNSAPLHDIGKIHVPDSILNKPGRLTEEEFAEMKLHTVVGSQIIRNVIETVDAKDKSYLQEAERLAHYHHERWDGKGYPSGLKGEEIPLSARIMAVADVFDALVSKRSYKEGFPFEKAMDIIREGAGSHFDPQIANAFIHAEKEVREVTQSRKK